MKSLLQKNQYQYLRPGPGVTRRRHRASVGDLIKTASQITCCFYSIFRTSANPGRQFGGGRGGIRTHGTLAGTPVFKTGALNHSATLPAQEFQSLSVGLARTQCERGPRCASIPSFWKKPSGEGAKALRTWCGGKRRRQLVLAGIASSRHRCRDRSGRLSSRTPQPAGLSTGARSWLSSGQEIRWRQCRGCA